ncbi:asparagine-tRNA ligase [Sphaceloma murrayae]|uniref:asparagine--tRNA ligase n=1 Tax=Sphaceloma murrayae TaxID=2082308 RepID=A0A2K1R1T9_9PEZI|nr:asparagine-tRNA ligase [Sphaceloma murrayae]
MSAPTRLSRYLRTLRVCKAIRTHQSQRNFANVVGEAGPVIPFSALLHVAPFQFDWVDKKIEVQGFVKTIRKHGSISMVNLRDGSNRADVQLILKREQVKGLSIGAAIKANGVWQASKSASKKPPFELVVEDLHLQGENDAETCPIQPKHQPAKTLRSALHLRPRREEFAAILNLRSDLITLLHKVMNTENFVYVHTPIITSSDCEGAGEVFEVLPKDARSGQKSEEEFFRAPKYLTVSAQLHLEAMAAALEKVWTLSPTFRAEKSDTSRHLSEFYMLETEIAFVNSLDPLMDQLEHLIKRMVRQVLYTPRNHDLIIRRAERLESAGADPREYVKSSELLKRWKGLCISKWPRVTYRQAIDVLQAAESKGEKFQNSVKWESGLSADHEKFLAAELGEGGPIFITDYPKEQKPFYMLPTPSGDGSTVACFDLIVPELCEIAGGSLREHRLDPLVKNMQEKGLLDHDIFDKKNEDGSNNDEFPETNLDWYMDLRMYGSVPHGGYGLGFDRLLAYFTGVSNVRDVAAFPRWYGKCDA